MIAAKAWMPRSPFGGTRLLKKLNAPQAMPMMMAPKQPRRSQSTTFVESPPPPARAPSPFHHRRNQSGSMTDLLGGAVRAVGAVLDRPDRGGSAVGRRRGGGARVPPGTVHLTPARRAGTTGGTRPARNDRSCRPDSRR